MSILIMGLGMPRANAQSIPGVIIDEDMSSDHDDLADFAMCNALAYLGKINLLAGMVDSTNGATALAMNAVTTYYGFPNIPIGVPPNIGGLGGYPGNIAAVFPHPLYQTPSQCPLAANLYRQLLASQPDHSVVIVTTGYLVNLQALLQTGSDQYSPLTGSQLVAQKVKLWACAGGYYPSGGEFNFTVMPESTYYVVNNWPAPATFIGFDFGEAIQTAGDWANLPMNSPMRYVWDGFATSPGYRWWPYPAWSQIAEFVGIFGQEGGMYNLYNTGRNNANPDGTDYWSSATPPTPQAYALETERYPLTQSINCLLNIVPGSPLPGQPGNLRATVISSSQINLQWDSNSNNETGFSIERRNNATGVFAQIATVGPGVTTYSDTGVPSASNCAYRVRAYTAAGSSSYAYNYVYSGWTETNLSNPGAPVFNYYQCSNLDVTYTAGSYYNNTGVSTGYSVNNDSTHGKNLAIDLMVSSFGNSGSYYVYFFYNDPNNWYRLNVSNSVSKFEKDVNGTISTIGSAAPNPNINDATAAMLFWQIFVSSSGTLQFYIYGTQVLNVSDTLSFSSGKIALGGSSNAPLYQNFHFDTTGNAVTGLVATPGSGTVGLSWNPVAGATGYAIFRNVCDGDVQTQSTPIATVTGTSYTDSTVIGGDNITYFYQVAAVTASGTATYGNEASVFPAATGAPLPPTGLAATGGANQISLSWNASSGATSYTVYRGNYAGGEYLSASIATLVATNSFTDTNAVGGDTYYYVVTAANSTGVSGNSNETSATATVGPVTGPPFANASFETPTINGYAYNPSGSGWTFSNNGGIQSNNSAYSGGLPFAPDGVQTAFLQGVGGTLATMSQSVTFPAGTYTISFYAAQRYGQIQPIKVTVDSTVVGTYTPASNNYADITTAPFTVTAGMHLVTFAATDSSADKTSFIDLVSISGSGGSAPAVPAGLAATAGNSQVSLSWSASTGQTSYNVYRGTHSGDENTTPIATGVTGTSYTDGSLTNGTAYYYTVAAVNSSGTSGYSNEAGATPSLPTYSQWASVYFASNPANAGATATPQNDGVTNLLKYLFDINPVVAMKASDRAALPAVGMTTLSRSTYLTLTYRQNLVETGLTINAQTCTDLQNWQTVTPNHILTTGTDPATGDPFIQFQVLVNPAGASREFIRLNVISSQ